MSFDVIRIRRCGQFCACGFGGNSNVRFRHRCADDPRKKNSRCYSNCFEDLSVHSHSHILSRYLSPIPPAINYNTVFMSCQYPLWTLFFPALHPYVQYRRYGRYQTARVLIYGIEHKPKSTARDFAQNQKMMQNIYYTPFHPCENLTFAHKLLTFKNIMQ